VELYTQPTDLTRHDYSRYLYDGQTGELLAWIKSEKGIKSAFDFETGSATAGGMDDFITVSAKIDKLMADDRKH
jgi:hypothetical protein